MENKVKENIEEGYVGRSIVEGKWLKHFWFGGGQTGTNKCSLTEDIDEVSICKDENEVKYFISIYNMTHKTKVDFDIIKVKRTRTIKLEEVI